MALPTSSSPPRASAWRAGRPVTTATARTAPASAVSTSGASGWMWAASGSSTIGARVPSKSRPTTTSAARATSAAYRSSPADDVNSTPPPWQNPGEGSGVVRGEDHREPVELHRVDGRDRTTDAQVEGQRLRRALELGGVVDGRRRDAAVPVVGADHLPARLGRRRGDPAGEPLDAGVVVDLDVHLALVDGRLLRLLGGSCRH